MEIQDKNFVCSSCGSEEKNNAGMCCGSERAAVCNCGSGKAEMSCDCSN